MIRQLFFGLFFFSTLSIFANPSILTQDSSSELIVYNRILAKVGDKTISVLDVMKKMDFFLQKNYPQYIGVKNAQYQFYSSQWRTYLSQMIDHELMLADAEKLELKVNDAEVREEILTRFGPNVMPTLDQLGLTYEETKQMIHDELLVQRVMWFRINSKALASVNSADVKIAYKKYCANHPDLQEWEYQVLAIRSPDETLGKALATKAFELLGKRKDLTSISQELKEGDATATITLSQDIHADDKTISSSHKQVLQTLSEGTFSTPIAQTNRVDNSLVHRIFYLKKYTKKLTPSFQNIAEKLKEELLEEAASKEASQYLQKLRERLGYDEKRMVETLPSDFQPFAFQ